MQPNHKHLAALADRARMARSEAEAHQIRFYEAICEAHPRMTYQQIADATGLSYGRVRQIVAEGRQVPETADV